MHDEKVLLKELVRVTTDNGYTSRLALASTLFVFLDKDPSRSNVKEGVRSFMIDAAAATLSNRPFHPSNNFASMLFTLQHPMVWAVGDRGKV